MYAILRKPVIFIIMYYNRCRAYGWLGLILNWHAIRFECVVPKCNAIYYYSGVGGGGLLEDYHMSTPSLLLH